VLKSQLGLQLWKIISIVTGNTPDIFLLPIGRFIIDEITLSHVPASQQNYQ
jgi:hypothetical protein